jgi:hypothetical protein
MNGINVLLWLNFAAPQLDSNQTELLQQVKAINEWANILLTNANPINRKEAYDSLTIGLEQALKNPAAADFDFKTELKGVSVQMPEDKAFEIYTWQLFQNDSSYLYGGLLKTKKGEVFKLMDKSATIKQPFQTRLKPAEWYGALYYNLVPFEHENKKMYLLFGYNAHDFFNRRKLIDVLFFENGKPKFGYNVLEMKDNSRKTRTVQRYIMEYSATVMATLNYSVVDKMIIYDNLVSAAPIKGQSSSNIPDGSYCGMRLEKGKWVYVDKIHKDDYDPATSWNNPTAPIPNPLFNEDSQKLDIFGKKKKEKK